MPVNQLSSVELQDLLAVIDLYHAMWNTKQLDGVLHCFADDAIVTVSGVPRRSSAVYQGRAEIRAFVRKHIWDYTIRSRSHHLVGGRIVWMMLAASEALRRVGVDWITCRVEAAVLDGKIASCTVTVTPQSTARLEAVSACVSDYLHEQFSSV